MRCFEIDDPNSWQPIYAPYFTALAPAEEWARWLDPEDYSSADANVEKLAKYSMGSAADPLRSLRDQLENFYRRNFSHVAHYHGCRIVNPADYERDGVRCCDIAELDRQALGLWGNSEAVRMALTGPMARNHARSCHGKVGLWYSRTGLLHHGNHYTTGGSEYLQVVSNGLGPDARAKLEARGRPAAIRCVIPLDELHPEVLRTCSYLSLRSQLTWRNPEAPQHIYALDWAFMHERPVPPERISIEYLPD